MLYNKDAIIFGQQIIVDSDCLFCLRELRGDCFEDFLSINNSPHTFTFKKVWLIGGWSPYDNHSFANAFSEDSE